MTCAERHGTGARFAPTAWGRARCLVSEPFAHTSGPHDASVVIVGEAWGEAEAETGKPFVGASGKELWRMLGEAWPDVAPADHLRAKWAFYMRDNGWIDVREDWLREAALFLFSMGNGSKPVLFRTDDSDRPCAQY